MSKVYQVDLLVRGCDICDICKKVEYITPAENEKEAIEIIKRGELNLSIDYSLYVLEWRAKLITRPTFIRRYNC